MLVTKLPQLPVWRCFPSDQRSYFRKRRPTKTPGIAKQCTTTRKTGRREQASDGWRGLLKIKLVLPRQKTAGYARRDAGLRSTCGGSTRCKYGESDMYVVCGMGRRRVVGERRGCGDVCIMYDVAGCWWWAVDYVCISCCRAPELPRGMGRHTYKSRPPTHAVSMRN
jgi:hypothetical protein